MHLLIRTRVMVVLFDVIKSLVCWSQPDHLENNVDASKLIKSKADEHILKTHPQT